MSGPDYAARAARGAAFLDGHVPGWAQRVDLDTLDMSNCRYCVLSQVAGNYRDAVQDFDIDSDLDAVALGFLRVSGDGSSWQRLAEAWAGEIRERREPARAPRTRAGGIMTGAGLMDARHAPDPPWPGEPEQCTCTRLVVATLEETLGCPAGWRYAPGTGWVHQ